MVACTTQFEVSRRTKEERNKTNGRNSYRPISAFGYSPLTIRFVLSLIFRIDVARLFLSLCVTDASGVRVFKHTHTHCLSRETLRIDVCVSVFFSILLVAFLVTHVKRKQTINTTSFRERTYETRANISERIIYGTVGKKKISGWEGEREKGSEKEWEKIFSGNVATCETVPHGIHPLTRTNIRAACCTVKGFQE